MASTGPGCWATARMPDGVSRSTAAAQRPRIVDSAVRVFARTGYWATPVTEIARDTGISAAHVFRLFDSKVGLFVAAVDRCYVLMAQAMVDAAERAAPAGSAEVLAAMSEAYADLVGDRDLLVLQVHAQSATAVPEVREAAQPWARTLTAGLTRVADQR